MNADAPPDAPDVRDAGEDGTTGVLSASVMIVSGRVVVEGEVVREGSCCCSFSATSGTASTRYPRSDGGGAVADETACSCTGSCTDGQEGLGGPTSEVRRIGSESRRPGVESKGVFVAVVGAESSGARSCASC